MSKWRDQQPVTDEDLVAYLDGMLDGDRAEFVEREVKMDRALEDRLDLMRRGERPFAEAYDQLLREAPRKRLKQILKLAKEPPPLEEEPAPAPSPGGGPPEGVRKEPWGGWRVLAAAAVLLAVFAGGLVTGRFIQLPEAGRERETHGWREMVAYYQTLFVKETLENATVDAQAQSANLRAALSHVGLDLSLALVSVAPLQYKRAEVLNFKGKPLVQIAYLFNGETPVSFCIIRSAKPAHGVTPDRQQGLNIAHWRSEGHGFMVIGHVPEKALSDIAEQLKQSLT